MTLNDVLSGTPEPEREMELWLIVNGMRRPFMNSNIERVSDAGHKAPPILIFSGDKQLSGEDK